jgi:hypothetical protein
VIELGLGFSHNIGVFHTFQRKHEPNQIISEINSKLQMFQRHY